MPPSNEFNDVLRAKFEFETDAQVKLEVNLKENFAM
jgi:hypothetical protein